MEHPVLTALRERPPGARVALVVEGGGMRGAVSGGMVLALHELGLQHAFDAAYGSSAGTLNAMWLVSGRARDGVPTWIDPALVNALIRRRRALRRGPVVDITTLVEQRYEQLSPGLFSAVLGSPTELHPIATEVQTGQAVDLHREIADDRSLRLALRASAALPLLAGPPVELGGRQLVDAGLSAAIPFRAAVQD
jgi:predicted patatin/cPLA2 family phospholipase